MKTAITATETTCVFNLLNNLRVLIKRGIKITTENASLEL